MTDERKQAETEESKYHFAREVIFNLRSCQAISEAVYMHWIDKLLKDEESYAALKVAEATKEMYLNMQYYMEYCQMKGYVTPQEWIEKHKHF